MDKTKSDSIVARAEVTNDMVNDVCAIKHAILESQHRAARGVNAEQLSLYYGIGHYISKRSRSENWGAGTLKAISEQLQKELPGLRGFSERSLINMRCFYEEWMPHLNYAATAAEISKTDYQSGINITSLSNIHQPVMAELYAEEFLGISFTHHIEILTKTKTLEQRAFYIRKAYENKWNKYQLRDILKVDLYNHQSAMPNNFSRTMSRSDALRAIEMFKDEYLLNFINVEELGVRDSEDIDERVIEQHIVQNVKNFMMTFGHDFTFVGNQYHLEMHNNELYPDLLFFNRELNALVCIELKKGEFKPGYLGQLSAYLKILDAKVKKTHENPSIGIILCKHANKSFVEFLIQDYNHPMGVATYKTKEEIKQLLPSEEQLLKLLNEDEEVQ